MQAAPAYGNVLLDVFDFLEARIAAAEAAGIPRAKLLVDPGIGFGKTVDHNLALLAGIGLFHGLGVPVLLGASRKRFLGTITGVDAPPTAWPARLPRRWPASPKASSSSASTTPPRRCRRWPAWQAIARGGVAPAA